MTQDNQHVNKETDRQRPGRPERETTISNRVKVMNWLLEEGVAQEEFSTREIAAHLKLDRKTVQSILADVKDVAWGLTQAPGGYRLASDTYFYKQLYTNRRLKQAVAEKVAEIVPPGTSLACSPGTTIAMCVDQLVHSGKHVQIVTNNVGVLDRLHSPDVPVVFTGGDYLPNVHACVGDLTEQAFERESCRTSLLGVSGISKNSELFVSRREEAPVLAKILEATRETVIVAADIHKLTQADFWNFCNVRNFMKQEPKREIFLVTNLPENIWPRGKNEKLRERAEKVLDTLKEIGVTVYLEEI